MATIAAFRNAMEAPRRNFKTLGLMTPGDRGILRSKYFAEAEVVDDCQRMMIYMPLMGVSFRRVERFIPLKRHLISMAVPELKILREEMYTADALGRECWEDILCELLPDGLPFADEVAAIDNELDAASLVEALRELEMQLKQANVSHNNVCENNIIIDTEGRLHLIRWYYATDGAGGDAQAFEQLCEQIMRKGNMMCVNDICSTSYSAAPRLEGHMEVRFPHEGVVAVRQITGWGFVDCENRIVIEPQYDWVSDFCEGRAEVETFEGMGLIDKSGCYIIPPCYYIVKFDEQSGHSWVYGDDGWAIFDYEGNQMCGFGECEPPQELFSDIEEVM